ncbi:LOW QUALITY PROTEIN: hypothetical protein MKX08_008996 [Trichoderma sp. CBMAI-0020]|nr:LOW QUALITY PROTEIN: hypothetical protein MKX08_008996 [Trichoderma sp. CBMAI-0020]
MDRVEITGPDPDDQKAGQGNAEVAPLGQGARSLTAPGLASRRKGQSMEASASSHWTSDRLVQFIAFHRAGASPLMVWSSQQQDPMVPKQEALL